MHRPFRKDLFNIYLRIVALFVLIIVVLGIITPYLISAQSDFAVVLGFVSIILVIPTAIALLYSIIAKIVKFYRFFR